MEERVIFMNKSEVILLIFYKFLSEKSVDKKEVLRECSISPLTFARYLGDIRRFLKDNLSCYTILYDKKTNRYVLDLKSCEAEK